ncbi:hypothetical protein [Geodermatophilus sp. DSM 44513]|uniref:hypothetical protein n=1 Tax=Geodermatophilus sp. DSM 44513 TaxID=1528104 RepID=UPI001411DEBF|nr:hypothetical protein [Geodermatophilus sp. DSM 44513]WNV75240.1 hypothetical protein RTG05_19990 [Geodermatophilus sp. DSM 44513]
MPGQAIFALLIPGDAAIRIAGFVVLAVIMRPVGGWEENYKPGLALLLVRSPLLPRSQPIARLMDGRSLVARSWR